MRVEPAAEAGRRFRERGVMALAIRIVPQDLVPDEVARCTQSDSKSSLERPRMATRKGELHSFPPHLRLDLETRCNIKPRCIYLQSIPSRNGRTGRIIDSTRPSWVRWGLFGAETVLDCSFGEPLMSGNFVPLAELLDVYGKRFDFTTNAQLLGPNMQDALLAGISSSTFPWRPPLQIFTPVQKRKLRHAVIDNMAALCRKKKGIPESPERNRSAHCDALQCVSR